MNQDKKIIGFTLIELMLSMAFVSVLLLAVAMTILQISNIYNKGLTLKDVNHSGRVMVDDIQDTIASSVPFDISASASSRYVSQDWGGRLCVGQYSYIWNYGSDIAGGDITRMNVYEDSSDTIRFVKAFDPNGIYCNEASRQIKRANAIELLNAGEHDLAIHLFSIESFDSAHDSRTNQRLYGVRFVIGTNNQKAITNNAGEIVCKIFGQADADPSYCAVSRFDIVTLAGNSVE